MALFNCADKSPNLFVDELFSAVALDLRVVQSTQEGIFGRMFFWVSVAADPQCGRMMGLHFTCIFT